MSVNSREKGKRGEREAVKYLKSLGYTQAMRTQQFSGRESTADVRLFPGCPLHIEVKFGYPRSAIDLGTKGWLNAIDQARNDCGMNHWVVMWKPRGAREWRITLEAGGSAPKTYVGDAGVLAALEDCGFYMAESNQ